MALKSLRVVARPADVKVLLAGIAVWAAAAIIFFRYPIFSSFDQVFGDLGDGSMIVYFHEHLFNVLMGRADLTSPPFFYPQRDVFGLGPAFLLNALPYAALRLLGADPFLSFQLVIIALTLASFMASLIVCVRHFHIRTSIALCAAVLMTFANNLFVKAGVGHPNFLLLYYIPCIVLVALWGFEDFPRVARRSIVRVAIAFALYALLFSTDVYTAWMFGFTLLIAAGSVGVLHGRSIVAAMRAHLRPVIVLFVTATAAFLIAFVPFLIIYVPVRTFAPLRTFREYISFAPFPPDIINVSVGNLVWGWLVEILRGVAGSEQILAVTPGMTALFLFMAYRLRKHPTGFAEWQVAFVAASAAVWFVGWLLTLRIGTFSGFWLVRYLIPGATGIRAGMRVQLIANLWIVLALALLLEHWIRTAPVAQLSKRKLLAAGAILFCLVEQINLMDNSRLPRAKVLAMLSAVPPPPAQCRAFFVSLSNQNFSGGEQVEAMWISNQTGLPTLNGLSSWKPPGWEIDRAATYLDEARQWIARHGMRETICFYDRAGRNWSYFFDGQGAPQGAQAPAKSSGETARPLDGLVK